MVGSLVCFKLVPYPVLSLSPPLHPQCSLLRFSNWVITMVCFVLLVRCRAQLVFKRKIEHLQAMQSRPKHMEDRTAAVDKMRGEREEERARKLAAFKAQRAAAGA